MAADGRFVFEASVWNESVGGQMYYCVRCTHFKHCSILHILQALFRHQRLTLLWLEPVTTYLGTLFRQDPSVSASLCQGCISALVSKSCFIVSSKVFFFYLSLLERFHLFSLESRCLNILLLSISYTPPRERTEVVV